MVVHQRTSLLENGHINQLFTNDIKVSRSAYYWFSESHKKRSVI
jgi:hypothetical protein